MYIVNTIRSFLRIDGVFYFRLFSTKNHQSMNNQFDVFGIAQTKKDKNKCGDYFLHKTFQDKFIVLVVADGVGSRPCDWLASKTTCEKFIEVIGEKINDNHHNFEANDLIDICTAVDNSVSNPPDTCKGMMSTLVAVVWNKETNFVHFINVGDSRIYKISKDNQITQLTSDDIKDVNVRDKNGKLILSGGYTVTRSGLTNAFGLLNVKVVPQSCQFDCGDTILLATDGFYNCSSTFKHDILNIAHSVNLNESISKLLHYYQDYQTDDSTVLFLRNNVIDFDLPKNKINIDYVEIKNKVGKFQLIDLMYEKLKQSILQKNKDVALDTLKIMENDLILPSREMLDDLILLTQKENYTETAIIRGIVNLIRKVMR